METRNDMQPLVASRSTHPGELLKVWLDDIGIRQKDFAATIGVPASRLNELIKGKRPMTEEMAKRIADTLGGVEADFWMRTQAHYEWNERMLKLRNEEEMRSDSQENALMGLFNLRELYRYLQISEVSSIRRLCELFKKIGVTYEEMTNRTAIVGCFKHSDTLRIDEKNMRTWVLIAQYEAARAHVAGVYSIQNADKAAGEIACLTNVGMLKEADIASVLSRSGIAYAVVQKLDGCPVDAYSVMIADKPAIIVTHRHNNMQKLIFDVLHEIGHITKHMTGSYSGFINADYSEDNPQESEANAYARDILIPPVIWRKIISLSIGTVREDIICRQIGLRAKSFGINPRIAVARYKHDSQAYRGRVYSSTKIV